MFNYIKVLKWFLKILNIWIFGVLLIWLYLIFDVDIFMNVILINFKDDYRKDIYFFL